MSGKNTLGSHAVNAVRRLSLSGLSVALCAATFVGLLASKGREAIAWDTFPGEDQGPFAVREWQEDPWMSVPEPVTAKEAEELALELQGLLPSYPLRGQIELRIRNAADPMGSKDDPRTFYDVLCHSDTHWTVGTDVDSQPSEEAEGIPNVLNKERRGDVIRATLPWAAPKFRTPIPPGFDIGSPLRLPKNLLAARFIQGTVDEGKTVLLSLRPTHAEVLSVLVWVSRETGLVERTVSRVVGPEPVEDTEHGHQPGDKKSKRRPTLLVKQRVKGVVPAFAAKPLIEAESPESVVEVNPAELSPVNFIAEGVRRK